MLEGRGARVVLEIKRGLRAALIEPYKFCVALTYIALLGLKWTG